MVSLKKFKKILILSGGISEERNISKLSANYVYETIKNELKTKILDVSDNAQEFLTKIKNIDLMLFSIVYMETLEKMDKSNQY